MPLDQVWQLAKRWYADRLDPAWTPRSAPAAQEILASVGLASEFWRIAK